MKKLLLGIAFLFLSCSEDDPEVDFPLEEDENFSSEIFFSEYMEGTSFNKSLEIVNLTGATIDLETEVYSIKKQQNGSGDWMSELMLTGSLSHNAVFVISNESANIPEILEEADLLKTGAPLDFNGNDALGLFKDGELIDVIGVIDNPEDFAIDQTLRRKAEITEPSTNFNINSWEIFEIDNVEGLGSY